MHNFLDSTASGSTCHSDFVELEYLRHCTSCSKSSSCSVTKCWSVHFWDSTSVTACCTSYDVRRKTFFRSEGPVLQFEITPESIVFGTANNNLMLSHTYSAKYDIIKIRNQVALYKWQS